MNQANFITFGTFPVTLRKVDDDVLINCKKVIGLYSQARAFRDNTNITGNYQFGIKMSDICDIKWSVKNPTNIRIACLEGTTEEMNNILEECEVLLDA